MSTKALKKELLAAVVMLLVAAVALSGSTYAWFAINNNVTVTGMEVTTSVSTNLFIAADTVANTAKKTDDDFKSELHQIVGGVLEPVSTIDGLNFFYTASNNVQANGDAINDTYIAYDKTTDVGKNAFDGNYGFPNDDNDEDCVGYVDYAFQLKAINSDVVERYVNLKKINLRYSGADTKLGMNAFRTAIFVETLGKDSAGVAVAGDAFHALGAVNGSTPYAATTLMTNTGAANQTATKAVNSTTTLADVTYGSFNYLTVPAQTTAYYKVIVRLYIEGEDKKCTNDTFAALADKWGLDLEFAMVDNANKLAKANITNEAYTLRGSETAIGAAINVNNASLKPVTTNNISGTATPVTYNGLQVYADKALTETGVKLYVPSGDILDTSVNPTEVTGNFTIL